MFMNAWLLPSGCVSLSELDETAHEAEAVDVSHAEDLPSKSLHGETPIAANHFVLQALLGLCLSVALWTLLSFF